MLRLSTAVSTAAACDSVPGFLSAAMSALLFLARADPGFRARLAQHLLVLDHFLEEVIQLFISNQAASKIRQASAEIEQLSKRRDLLSDFSRLEIVHGLEAQLDVELGVVFGQAVVHLESQPWA